MTHKGSIYLAGRWLQGAPGGMLEVPAETLVALFTLQYCQNNCIRVILVASRGNPKTCKFPVSVASLCFGVEVKGEEECPEVLCHCELPAMIPEEEEQEEKKIKKKKERGKKKDEIVNRNGVVSRKGEQLEEKEEDERKEEEKEEDKKKQNAVKKRKQKVSDKCKGAIEKQLMKKEEEEEKEKEQKKKLDELQKGKQEEEEEEKDKGEKERQDDREKQNQEEKEEKEANHEREKEKSSENQKEKENTEMEGGGDGDCKNGDDNDDGDAWREGPWCCAGLCSSLRLAVKQAVETRTLEKNGRNRRNTAANSNRDAGKRSNTRSNTGRTNEKARNTESSGSDTASNTNINIGSISNTTNNESNTATNTIDTDNQSNTTSNASNKFGNTPHHAAALLGFRGGCLQACAEVSVWTKFCEVEAPAALLSLALAPYRGGEEVEYPRELLRYECHLRRPPILHNALKRTQRHIRETVKDGTERDELIRRPLAQLPPLNHQFAEGPDMTLADLMLFSCFHLVLASLTSSAVEPSAITPLVSAWHGTMALNGHVQMALPVLEDAKALLCGTPSPAVPLRVVVPSVPDVSIYKSDPERSRATRGAFTRQGDVEEVLRVVEGAGVEPEYTPWPPRSTSSSSSTSSPSFFTSSSSSSSSSTFTSTSSFSSFSSLSASSSSSASEPPPLHTLLPALSLEGHIPESRLARKVQQVENMCSAVLALVQPGDVVVDFCSGGGHVGIPLAQCLPGCRVLLVENKVPSLERARERVRHLRLPNVWFMQTNLDYFRGGFDVGVSLHACGAATDLVLGKCVAQGAAFVVAPCCYGSIRPNHVVSYPRSQAFHSLPLTLDQYLTLGHAADQTHGRDNPKTEQGQQCMRLVDGDRLAAAREVGYTAGLALMHPPTCSPKNHLLLGRPTP